MKAATETFPCTKYSHGLQVIKIQEGARHSVLTKLINYLTD